jgi:hypothetical protein
MNSFLQNKDFIRWVKTLNWSYYLFIATCLIIISVSLIASPKRYKSIEEYQEDTNKGKTILSMMGETSLGTFSPPSTNRVFWDSIKDKPRKIPPPEDIKDDIRVLNEIAIIREGTKQECFYPDQTWIPQIENAMESLLTKYWHNQELFKVPLVGLEQTETGVVLANSIGLIGSKLNPDLIKKVKQKLRDAIIQPYKEDLQLSQHKKLRFNFDRCPWIGKPGNWNAVCTANIIYISMIILEDKEEIADLVAKSHENIESYLQSFETDGYLSEGIRYWFYGFSHFIQLAESLLKLTQGQLNLYENPKIKDIVEFPLKTRIGSNKALNLEYYPLFTDNNNPIREAQDNFEWYMLSKRTKLPFKVNAPTKYFYSDAELDLLLNPPKTNPNYKPLDIEMPSGTIYFKSAGVLFSWWPHNNEVLVTKGGSNSEHHNHNDIGAYTLFTKGPQEEMLPVTGDLGDIEYTTENIGTYRYKFDLLSSYGHPVPVIDSQLQNNSPKSRAIVLLAKADNDKDMITYDITGAYLVKGLTKATREIVSEKGPRPNLFVKDSFESNRPIKFETPVILPNEPQKIDTNKYEIDIKNNRFHIEIFSNRSFTSKIEELDKEGYKYTKRGGPRDLGYPHRISIEIEGEHTSGSISYKIYKVSKKNVPLPEKLIPPQKPPSNPKDNTVDMEPPDLNKLFNPSTLSQITTNIESTLTSPKRSLWSNLPDNEQYNPFSLETKELKWRPDINTKISDDKPNSNEENKSIFIRNPQGN